MRKLILTLLAILMIAFSAEAQRTEKRIYLLDLTGSMEGRGNIESPNILQTVKNNLAATIENIDDPNTEIVIIPFTNTPHEIIEGRVSSKDSLIAQVQRLGVRPGDTNIADAWNEGLKNLDDSKINYLFLLTDGLHNTGPSKQVLFDRLKMWEETAKGNAKYAFYVMLTPNAKETGIYEIVDSTAQMWLIESMDINASLIHTDINQRKNIFSNSSTSISFLSNNLSTDFDDLGLQIYFEENDCYSVENVKKSVVGNVYTFDIIEKLPKIDLPLDTTLTLKLSIDKEKNPFVFLTPEEISFQVINQGPRILKISVPNSKKGLEDLNFRKLKYKEPFQGLFRWARKIYEPTLDWFFMSRPDTASTTTSLILNWNEEALRAGSGIQFNLVTSDIENGRHIQVSNSDKNLVHKAKNISDTLHLKTSVIPGIPSTRFSGNIVAITDNIDTINDIELNIGEKIIGRWRLSYKKGWPFWIWVFWLLLTVATIALAVIVVQLCIKGIVLLFEIIKRKRRPWRPKRLKRRRNGDDGDDDDDDDDDSLNKRIHYLVNAYINSQTISEGCDYLLQLLFAMEDLKDIDPEENERVFAHLPEAVRSDLDKLNAAWKLPKSNGRWKNPFRKGDCLWIPDDNHVPNNREYSNVFNKSWSQIKKQYNIKGIVYERGIPDFSPVSLSSGSVTFDWERELGPEKMCKLLSSKKERKDLHEAAFAILAKKRGISVSELKERKEKPGSNLVWHEEIDGKTVRLVNQEVHGNLNHIGGLAIAQIVGVSPARVYRHFSMNSSGKVNYLR